VRLGTAAFLAFLPFGAPVVAAGVLVLVDVVVELFLLLPHAAIPSTAIKMPGRNSFKRIGLPPLDIPAVRTWYCPVFSHRTLWWWWWAR
jgi:hypothetical protein